MNTFNHLNKNTLESISYVCEKCSKITNEKFGSGRFCSRACANSRNHSIETKQKIKKTLISFYNKETKECIICKKIIDYKNSTNLCLDCLRNTDYGKNILSNIGIDAAKTRSENGFIPKWPDNYTIPRSERFWAKILKMYNVNFIKELPIRHLKTSYMLDFYIEIKNFKIDLEIDGQYHNQKSVVEHDLERDNFLKGKGFIVYRLPWKTKKSRSWKKELKQQVYDFMIFLKNLQNQNGGLV